MTISIELLQSILIGIIAVLAPIFIGRLRSNQVSPVPLRRDESKDAIEQVADMQGDLSAALLSERISVDDLEELAFTVLDIPLADLGNTSKTQKAIRLMQVAKNQKKLFKLWRALHKQRPDLD